MKKRVLVAPLDWGLGHATRCIPLIDHMLKQEIEVILAGSADSLILLTKEFPQLSAYPLPSYGVRYSPNAFQMGKILAQTPRLLQVIRNEHRVLETLNKQYPLAGVISDNRYGCYLSDTPSLMLCHQLSPLLPHALSWLQPMVSFFHKQALKPFDALWVPDYAGSKSLSGQLSHGSFSQPVQRIGPLSRFAQERPSSLQFSHESLNTTMPEILVILSGPEPQRSLLEKKLISQLKALDFPCWLVQGTPAQDSIRRIANLTIIPFLQRADLRLALGKAQVLISRPGYSSLMDYAALGIKRALLIPTPGQTEQEYLARRMAQLGIAPAFSQQNFSLEKALKQLASYKGWQVPFQNDTFTTYLDQWLSSL